MKKPLGSFVSVFLPVCLLSCGGSTAMPAPTNASTRSDWQVVLTVKTNAVNFGIAGMALDGKGNLYLTEMDHDLIMADRRVPTTACLCAARP